MILASQTLRRQTVPIAFLMAAALLGGCAAAAPVTTAALKVVMNIATQVVVSIGADYVTKLLSPADEAKAAPAPVLRIKHSDVNGNLVTTTYRVDKMDAITLTAVRGEVSIASDGHTGTVTVAPRSTATIEIGPSEGGTTVEVIAAPVQAVAASTPSTPRTTAKDSPPKATIAKTTAPPPVVITSPPPPVVIPPQAPQITGTDTYLEDKLILLRVNFTDANGDAEGFGFRGVNGSGWAPESHPFANPSYGRVSPGRVDYPFNHSCGTAYPAESDVEFWIYDSTGARSQSRTVHLSCAG